MYLLEWQPPPPACPRPGDHLAARRQGSRAAPGKGAAHTPATCIPQGCVRNTVETSPPVAVARPSKLGRWHVAKIAPWNWTQWFAKFLNGLFGGFRGGGIRLPRTKCEAGAAGGGAAVGAVIGGIFGGPIGAVIGGVVGAYVGNAAPKTSPRCEVSGGCSLKGLFNRGPADGSWLVSKPPTFRQEEPRMNVHSRARTCPASRALLVQRIRDHQVPDSHHC
jgi:hypothetical protein